MKFLIFFTFGVLFGSAWCDDTCFNRQFEKYLVRYIDDISKVYSSCYTLQAQGISVLSAAMDCNTGFIKKAFEYQRVLNDACSKNDCNYEKFRHCLGNSVNGSNCQKPYRDIMKDRTTPKEILEGMKQACKKSDWFGRCLQGNTEDFCGGIKSDYFYDKVLKRVIDLNEHLCNEVILPADENLSELVILGLPRLIEATVAILTIP